MTVARDTYVSAMLGLTNWQTWPDVKGGFSGANRYPTFDLDDPELDKIDRILLASEPFRFAAMHRAELATDAWLGNRAIGSTLSTGRWQGTRLMPVRARFSVIWGSVP